MKPSEFHSIRRFVDTPSGRIAYVERGQGPVALFLHGLPLCGFQWRGALEDLAPVRRCIALDLMGLGYSEVPAKQDVSFAAQAAMVAQFLDALKIDRVDLCGNDTGGGVGQVFAASYPARVRGLTLTNCEVSDLWPNEMLTGFYATVGSGVVIQGFKMMLADVGVARNGFASVYENPEALTAEAMEVYLAPLVGSEERIEQFRGFAQWERSRAQLVERAPALRASKIPAQVIWGEADTAFDTPRSLEWLRANLGGLRKVIAVPRAKLFFPEEHPRLMSVMLREFWQTLG